MTHDII